MPLKARRIDIELESLPKAKAAFIEPMLLFRARALPEAGGWLYQRLLEFENVRLKFSDDALEAIAVLAMENRAGQLK